MKRVRELEETAYCGACTKECSVIEERCDDTLEFWGAPCTTTTYELLSSCCKEPCLFTDKDLTQEFEL